MKIHPITWTFGWLASAAFVLPLTSLVQAQEAPPATESPAAQEAPAEPQQPQSQPQDSPQQQDQQQAAPNFWLGLQLSPPPEILRSHVERLQQGAATVVGVAPNSPAAEAGLQEGDHVLKLDDQQVTGPQQIVEAVRSSEGEKMTLQVLRGLEVVDIEVTPSEAPANLFSRRPRLEEGQPGADRFGFERGQLIPPQLRLGMLDENMPQNVVIRIQQTGDEPAQIHIERDGQTWDVTEDEIDQLPEDLQALARQYVERADEGQMIFGGREIPMSQMLRMFGDQQPGALGGNVPNFRQMQEQMRRDMQEMREMMQELRQRFDQQDDAETPQNEPQLEGDEV